MKTSVLSVASTIRDYVSDSYMSSIPDKYKQLIGELSEKRTLTYLMEYMDKHDGCIPKNCWSLAKELGSYAILHHVTRNNGNLRGELSPSSLICYKHYRRLNDGSFLKRWLWLKTLAFLRSEYLRELDRIIEKTEMVNLKLMF